MCGKKGSSAALSCNKPPGHASHDHTFVMAAQVPRAPGSCCLAFNPATDSDCEDKGNAGPDWTVYGEDGSHAALHIMPEWAEVGTFSNIGLCV